MGVPWAEGGGCGITVGWMEGTDGVTLCWMEVGTQGHPALSEEGL